MKLTLATVAVCIILLATLTESTPTPEVPLLNVTAPTASASMVDRIMNFQDHIRQWANQLSEKTRSAFQKLQVQEVNRVMSTWFSDIGKKFGGFGKKAK
ncbi:apolipoprotein C-I isoform X2 [Scyliorhinus torazame]